MARTKGEANIRWGLDASIASQSARERLLDAARTCYARQGIAKTTMADIASEAKVTRRTVYRYFASHQQILNGVVHREAYQFWTRLHGYLSTAETFDDYLVEALIYTLKHAPETPTHRFLFDQSILPVVHEMYLSNEEMLRLAADNLRPVYERLAPGGKLDLLMVTEWFNRVVVSYLATPSPFFHSEEELRDLFRTMLSPALRAGSQA